jgi:hypothetical protein
MRGEEDYLKDNIDPGQREDPSNLYYAQKISSPD